MRGDLSCIEKKHAQSRLPMSATSKFLDLKNANRQGRGGVAVSVCSAHPLVLRAALRYGETPQHLRADRVDFESGRSVRRLYRNDAAAVRLDGQFAGENEEGFPISEILLGGDHLGPNSWRMQRTGSAAMVEACKLVEQYVTAGYRKIHLDASFICADDTLPLSPEVIVKRCVEMARTAESVADR
jgi:tagatose-1,6-bisphosphate aldolase non-catalytic subunit AgaZ/GatZ